MYQSKTNEVYSPESPPFEVLEGVNKYLKTVGVKVVTLKLVGSRSEGLECVDSDWDFKGIYLPSVKELAMGTTLKTIRYKSNDGKFEVILSPVGKVLKQASKGNFEILLSPFLPDIIVPTMEMRFFNEQITRLYGTTVMCASMERTKKRIALYERGIFTGGEATANITNRDNLHALRDILIIHKILKGEHPITGNDKELLMSIKCATESNDELMVTLLSKLLNDTIGHVPTGNPDPILTSMALMVIQIMTR